MVKGLVVIFQDFPVLENAKVKFQDFPGFPGPVRTLLVWRGEGGWGRGSESPASRTLYSRFPPPFFEVPTAACFFSYFVWLLTPWVSCLLLSVLPPPIDFLSPLLPGSSLSVPLHCMRCLFELKDRLASHMVHSDHTVFSVYTVYLVHTVHLGYTVCSMGGKFGLVVGRSAPLTPPCTKHFKW